MSVCPYRVYIAADTNLPFWKFRGGDLTVFCLCVKKFYENVVIFFASYIFVVRKSRQFMP
jgi:hypothetical protein